MKKILFYVCFSVISLCLSAQSRLMTEIDGNSHDENLQALQPDRFVVGCECWGGSHGGDAVYLVDEYDSYVLIYNEFEKEKCVQRKLVIPQNVAMLINSIITSSVETAMPQKEGLDCSNSEQVNYSFYKDKETKALMKNPIENTTCERLKMFYVTLCNTVKSEEMGKLSDSMQHLQMLDRDLKSLYLIDSYKPSWGIMTQMSRDFIVNTMTMGRATINLAIEAPRELSDNREVLMEYSEKNMQKYQSLLIDCCQWQLFNQPKDLYIELIFTDEEVKHNLIIEASGFYGGAYIVILPKDKFSLEGIKESLTKVFSYSEIGEYHVEF